MTAALPPMPRPRAAAAGADDDGGELPGCWRACDKYDFVNLGVSRVDGGDDSRSRTTVTGI